jgi:hypothetical protein
MTQNKKNNLQEIDGKKLRLQLREERARTTIALPPGTVHEVTQLEHDVNLHLQALGYEGLGHLDKIAIPAEHEIFNQLTKLIDELHPKGKEILQRSLAEYQKEARLIWNDLRDWDHSIPCTVKGCEHIVLKSLASNTVDLWERTEILLTQIFVSYGITEDVIDSIIIWENRTIDWLYLRGMLHAIITKKLDIADKISNGEIKVGHHTINITDFGTKEKCFSRLELKAIEEIDRPLASLCHFMNICGSKTLQCPSGHDLWACQRINTADSIYDFEFTSRAAIESCIRTIVGNAVTSTPKTLVGRVNGQKKVIFRGKIGGKSNNRIEHAIAESVLLCNSILGEIDVPFIDDSSKKITFSPNDNLTDKKVYCAINTKVVEDLADKIKNLKPYAFFLQEGLGVIEWNSWAANLAIDILHAFNMNDFLIKDDKSKHFAFSNGTSPDRETNLLKLTTPLMDKILTQFRAVNPSGGEFNALELMLNKETTPPMVHLPLDRPTDKSIDLVSQGGFLNPMMQLRYPLISNNSIENTFDIIRLEPSTKAIETVNHLQKTEWAINEKIKPIIEEMLRCFVKENIANLFEIRKTNRVKLITGKSLFKRSIRKDVLLEIQTSDKLDIKNILNSKWNNLNRNQKDIWNEKAEQKMEQEIYCLDMKKYPCLTLGQITQWNASLQFIKLLEDEFANPEHRSFFHVWSLDWRGRMYTCSTILSPQNDDFSRGLLRFANSLKLDENGWLWLKRYTASLMRGRKLSTDEFTQSQIDEWSKIQEDLSNKTFEGQDNATNNPIFFQVLKVIANDPIATRLTWAHEDIFTAKSEGFQRIAAILAYVDAYEQGGSGAKVNLPINQDASSSVYQHASLLVRDKDMAKLVNIVQDGQLPADVYQEVIDDLDNCWSQNSPFDELDLSSENIIKIKESVLIRKVAKKPVMTISYGAKNRNMMKALLSHNGEKSGLLGGWVPLWKSEVNRFVRVPDDQIDSTADDEKNWRMVAHPSCILNNALNEIDPVFHEEISRIVIVGLLKSVDNVLPGFEIMMKHLKQIIVASPEKCIEWKLVDGTIVRNVKLKRAETKAKPAPKGLEGTAQGNRRNVREHLDSDGKNAIPIDNMLNPINWNALSEIDSDTLNDFKEIEKQRFEKLNDELNSIELKEQSLFNFEHRQLVKLQNPEASNKEVSTTLKQMWNDCDVEMQEEYKSRIIALFDCVVGSTIEELHIDWALFRYGAGNDGVGPLSEIERKNLHPKIRKPINRFIGRAPCTFSRRILTGERNKGGESLGISPNFVHSHDACHMRLVVADMWDNGITDIWSVHDSFGCHPNHIEFLRTSAIENIKLTHKGPNDCKGMLDELMLKHLGKGIEGNMDLEEVNGKYLIS